jgi:hypothetical protein
MGVEVDGVKKASESGDTASALSTSSSALYMLIE